MVDGGKLVDFVQMAPGVRVSPIDTRSLNSIDTVIFGDGVLLNVIGSFREVVQYGSVLFTNILV